jgi:hypothetical protein
MSDPLATPAPETAPGPGGGTAAGLGEPRSAAAAITVGALFGLLWAAGLRGYMVALAGESSQFGWLGTFGALLLPGAVTGALLGWAEHLRRTGGRRHWRLLGLAPLVLAVAPLVLLPDALFALVTQGLGGGAIAFALTGMAGGFALSGRGPRWARIACGLVLVVIGAGVALSTSAVGGPDLALTTPHGAWAALLGAGSVLTLAVASSIPHRPVVTPERPGAQ